MRCHSTRRGGFTYIEAVVSSLILSLGIVSAMHVYGTYAKGALIDSEMALAEGLAAELLAEVAAQAFEDSAFAPGSFGRAVDETVRADFEDVDDYDGWCESPPQARDGTVLADYSDYVRCVTVYNVDEATLSAKAVDGSTAAKRIEVTVTRNGRLRAQLEAIRMRCDETY